MKALPLHPKFYARLMDIYGPDMNGRVDDVVASLTARNEEVRKMPLSEMVAE
jgi:hypothetical protein